VIEFWTWAGLGAFIGQRLRESLEAGCPFCAANASALLAALVRTDAGHLEGVAQHDGRANLWNRDHWAVRRSLAVQAMIMQAVNHAAPMPAPAPQGRRLH